MRLQSWVRMWRARNAYRKEQQHIRARHAKRRRKGGCVRNTTAISYTHAVIIMNAAVPSPNMAVWLRHLH